MPTATDDKAPDTHPYAVYKTLYDAVANGYTEEDYSTTDWESSKGKMNNGEIATMVYKTLYDAVANGYTEEDYSTTDWESSKGKMNNGEIATMVLGAWAVPQMKQAGEHADDVQYMPFPITVDGKQYATLAGNYSMGINKNSDKDRQEAAMIFVKWMTEKSGYAKNEGGIPIVKNDDSYPDTYGHFKDVELIVDDPAKEGEEDLFADINSAKNEGGIPIVKNDDSYPDTYGHFKDVELIVDDPAKEGEEDLFADINSDSELGINNGNGKKIQDIVVDAANKSKTIDQIMGEWDQKWGKAVESES